MSVSVDVICFIAEAGKAKTFALLMQSDSEHQGCPKVKALICVFTKNLKFINQITVFAVLDNIKCCYYMKGP